MMKRHFNKELAMAAKDHEDFENSTNSLICDNPYFHGDVKVRDPCDIPAKYRGSARKDCNINVK